MISVRRLLAFSVTSLSTVAAQWLDDRPLGSCADLGCPQRDNVTIVPACRVDNQTYDGIGVDTFPFNASDPDSQNLTWTMAYHDYTNYDPDKKLERTIEKAFFLGTPDGLNLTDASAYGGCAVILEAYDTRFPGDGGLKGFKCEDTIGSDCYKELQGDVLSFAKNQSRQTNSTVDMCDGLEDYIKSISSSSSSDSKCSMTWTQKHYLPLTGPSAPAILTKEQNSTSNCYPTEPKTNDLALVLNWNNTGTMYYNDTIKMLKSVNVALTVFWSNAGANASVQELEPHLSCLWPMDETSRSRATKEPSAAGRLRVARLAAVGAGLVMAWSVL